LKSEVIDFLKRKEKKIEKVKSSCVRTISLFPKKRRHVRWRH